MEILKYSAFIIGCLFVVGAANAVLNHSKQNRCIEAGGQFVLNSSDANLSMCLMGK